jgi:glycosyltransferase involved in cell wall biosynthesis
LAALTRHETGPVSVDAVYQDFDRWVARRLERVAGASIVYAYEDAAEAMFHEASRLGWRRVYDLPIAHWKKSRQLLDEEAERYPDWEPTLLGTRDSAEKQERKDRELALADIVVCPSRFVADSLPENVCAKKQVVIAPFGSPAAVAGPAEMRKRGGPLRVLFAGSMSQRKGLADLFAALRELKRSDVQLVVLGSPVADMAFYRREYPDFIHEASRPHADVLALMRTCDVLCLPSIVEGRALVVQEAMSQGLPAIVTSHTGADDVVEEGSSGFVVPIRSPARIASVIAWCADHREELGGFSMRASAAAARFTWDRYGERILAALGNGRGTLAG